MTDLFSASGQPPPCEKGNSVGDPAGLKSGGKEEGTMHALIALTLVFSLFPEPILACVNHTNSLENPTLKSPVAIFLNILLLLTVTTPLGFLLGRAAKHLSRTKRIAAFTLLTSGFLMAYSYTVSACHGVKIVQPILKQVYEAQVSYRKKFGIYAASFEDLRISPSSDQYSYFLPSETLSAKNPFPKEGVDLSRLPEGISPITSADKFTVVAIAYSEPNRIDVWTMDHNERFKEWSVPAIAKRAMKSQKDRPVTTEGSFERVMTKFEVPLMLIASLVGLMIGFILSRRAPVIPIPQRL